MKQQFFGSTSLHLDTLFWFRANQSMIFLHIAVSLVLFWLRANQSILFLHIAVSLVEIQQI